MVAKDKKTLAELIAPDSVLVHMTGYVQPVKEWLAQIESEEMRYYAWQEDAIKAIHITDNTASLVGQSRVKARVWEQDQPLGACKLKWILKRLTVIGKLSNKVQALTRLERQI